MTADEQARLDATKLERLRQQAAALRRRIDAIERSTLSGSSIGGTGGIGGGGVDPYEAQQLNDQVRAGQGLDVLQRDLAALEARIEAAEHAAGN